MRERPPRPQTSAPRRSAAPRSTPLWRFALRVAASLAVMAAPGLAAALELGEIAIEGVDGALAENIRARLSLANHPEDEPLTEARLSYLLRQAPGEVLTALEPFGFYHAELQVEPVRSGERVDVRIAVTRGAPVRVRTQAIVLEGEGSGDPVLQRHRGNFRPAVGQVLDHRVYEQSKNELQRELLARGYFDAEPGEQRVEVTRAEHAADIALGWNTGARHAFGATRFVDSHIDEELLQRYVPWQPGQPFDHAQLVELHQALTGLEYFGLVDIQPRPDAGDEGLVPVEVALTPAKRTLYTAGLSYGTDHGAAIELGMQRRYLNRAGHKLDIDLAIGQRRSIGGVVYRIPATGGPKGWWSAGLNVREQEIAGFKRVEAAELVVGRNAEWKGYLAAAELHVLRERFDDQQATVVFPQLHVGHSQGDDPLYPRNGLGWSATARAGHSAFGSDADFAQLLGQVTWIRPLGASNRLLLRGAAGSSWIAQGDFAAFPPSLRFYAGGDRSVRGYGYQELGPRDAEGRVIGGKHLLAGSAEVEHMFTEDWGIAGFVDAGDAFNDDFDARVGVGLGVRWRSPVGPVRVDVGVGLDDPERTVRLHLTIGPEL